MKFNKLNLVLFCLLFISIFIVISNGTKNTPYQQQDEQDEISLTDDPITQSWFNFDFDFPILEIEIPIISGLLGLESTGSWIIIIVFILVILLVVGSMIVTRRTKTKKEKIESEGNLIELERTELKVRRQTLGKRIEEIIEFLKSCLDGRYSQGITEGFERLDIAMKEYSKISRPGWLTPREFTLLYIPYFDHEALISAVEQFYRITYGQKKATQKELLEYIGYFNRMIVDQKALRWKSDQILEGGQ